MDGVKPRPISVVVLAAANLAAPSSLPSIDLVVSRATAYVESYQRDLGSVVAEERYEQRIIESGAVTTRRLLQSEYLMLRVPGPDDRWLGFRDVYAVDDRPVRNREERFNRLLADAGNDGRLAWVRLAEASARYNIGDVRRTINVPTFPLVLLERDNVKRFRFKKRGEQPVEGLDCWQVSFDERDRPTIVRNSKGRNVPLGGMLWIDPSSGRVARTEVQTNDRDLQLRAHLIVRYAPEARLGLWVPVEMVEQYISRTDQKIEGQAGYTNYRRFQVDARIKPR